MASRSRIPEIIVRIESEVSNAVERCGLRIEAGAKQRARVDTGYMRGEIRWTRESPYSGRVIGGAYYTIFNEFGTAYMSAQPMFGPAVEEAKPLFFADIEMGLRRAVG